MHQVFVVVLESLLITSVNSCFYIVVITKQTTGTLCTVLSRSRWTGRSGIFKQNFNNLRYNSLGYKFVILHTGCSSASEAKALRRYTNLIIIILYCQSSSYV